MSLSLRVETRAWRQHLQDFAASVPGLVPVAKGNGYGFRNATLAVEAQRLHSDVLALGIAREAMRILDAGWRGDVVILNPWRPGDRVGTDLLRNPRVITTISRPEDLAEVRKINSQARVQLELGTTMRRHGLRVEDLSSLDFDGVEAFSVHLPATGSLAEATELAQGARRAHPTEIWVSHLSVDDYRRFRDSLDGAARMRVGTRLWLGAPNTLRTTATVLDVHPIRRGDRLGYHQHKAPRDGFIVVASGGTAHGIALAAPVPQRSMRQRVVTIAQGALDATGRSLSPFSIGGKKRGFAEPPHMHSSMIFVPGSDPLVAVGDEIPVTCRMTTTSFDQIVWG